MPDATSETWRPIIGYEGAYEVSDQGRVRVLARRDARGWRRKAATLTPWPRSKGHYLCVTLCVNAAEAKRYVHDLVLEAFSGPRPEPGMQGRHMDGNYPNNRAVNLEWGTPAENGQDRVRHGTSRRELSAACKRGHPFTPENTSVKPDGERRCLACHAAGEAARRLRKKAAA